MMWILAQELNDETVSPGALGTLVVVCMGIALVFLIKSMNKRISNVNAPRQADLDQEAWEAAEATRAQEDSTP
ncbi:hypothetical protein [Actinocorallia populi]|uniref:hypothetical protein n=1 Tax=Actinocorallia populi TaxID=2079200 RepID=UPI000D089CE3|nr:hypothetical protein [Actinocorallia populi]